MYKEITLPIESSLIEKLKKHIKIKKFYSKFLFYIFVLKNLFFAIVYYHYKLVEYIFNIFRKKPNFENGVFFLTLKNSKTINSCQGENNIFSWYKKNF